MKKLLVFTLVLALSVPCVVMAYSSIGTATFWVSLPEESHAKCWSDGKVIYDGAMRNPHHRPESETDIFFYNEYDQIVRISGNCVITYGEKTKHKEDSK